MLRKTTFEDPVHVGLSSDTRSESVEWISTVLKIFLFKQDFAMSSDTRSGSVDQYRSKNISFQTRLRNFRNDSYRYFYEVLYK